VRGAGPGEGPTKVREDRMRLGEAVRRGAVRLEAVTDVPCLEAEVLLAYSTGLSRTALLAHSERPLSPEEAARYRALLDRRASGYPLPYLIGRVEFYGLDFVVSPAVLIPRPETETLVDLALARRPRTVVDVGTGSGCIAVSLAVHLPRVRVWATDLSVAALRVAAENARRHGVARRVCFIQCDLVRPVAGPVDLVVANPPYVAEPEWTTLPLSVRLHEPRLALDGGSDGLAVVRRLLRTAPRVLRSGGALLIEIGAGQGDAAAALARSFLPSAHVQVHSDLGGRDRVLEVVP